MVTTSWGKDGEFDIRFTFIIRTSNSFNRCNIIADRKYRMSRDVVQYQSGETVVQYHSPQYV